ncbi:MULTISPECIES: copper-binding protein [Rhodanobacter]|uniref:copper-binding protein n=1 Tax=Rhodanobacter TaxID=75309 RepID=UPI000415171D|nr:MULTISPECIES: copper-binding protein [Rhodanobacter]TAN14862.1 MAG: copper-binding protein [Rhodanobacter sp.]UJJ56319.1 copper-binding protein [Rhodanobacter thiooxydans]
MKKALFALALTGALVAVPAFALQMDPNMPAMQHQAKPAEAQGVGIVKAIDTNEGTVTLQHLAIASIGWPAMTMAFKAGSPDVLKAAKVGDEVQFTVHPAGMASTVTSIKPLQK